MYALGVMEVLVADRRGLDLEEHSNSDELNSTLQTRLAGCDSLARCTIDMCKGVWFDSEIESKIAAATCIEIVGLECMKLMTYLDFDCIKMRRP